MDDQVRTLESLHRRYASVVFDKCVRVMGNAADADDAVQQTFINAFRALPAFRDAGHGHLPWLYRIATNVCLKMITTRRKRGTTPLDDERQAIAAPRADPVATLHARAILEQLVDLVDEKTLAIFVAHYVDGLDQGEIAAELGISRRAVVKRLTALRAKASTLLGVEAHDG